MKQHDIVIMGDGIAGLTLALALAQHEFDTAVIVKNIQPTPIKEKYDARVSAITLASERIFRHIGVWDKITARRVCPFRDMRVWDSVGPGKIHFDSAWLGQPYLGHIIENSVILTALQEQLSQQPHLTLYENFTPHDILPTADNIIIQGKTPLSAALLVGADGAHSWVREKAGFALDERDYEHTAIVATVETEQPHQETAWQRFLPTGPLAFLPLNDAHYCSIVWSCTPEFATTILADDDTKFCAVLASAFEYQLGNIISTSARHSFPLVMRHVKHYAKSHIALLGDAAHTIHPLAGQGLNMGLMDVAVLLDVLIAGRHLHRPLGYLPILRRYERARHTDNALILQIMDGFKSLFGDKHTWLTAVRNSGLNWVDNQAWLKNHIMRHAMGEALELPTLARKD